MMKIYIYIQVLEPVSILTIEDDAKMFKKRFDIVVFDKESIF